MASFFLFFFKFMCLLVTVKKNVSKISPFRKPIDGLEKSEWHFSTNMEPELSAKKPPKLFYENDARE